MLTKSQIEKLKSYAAPAVKILLFFLCVYFILNILFFDNFSLYAFKKSKNRLNELKVANRDLDKKNKALEAEIDKLKNDPNYIESIARKNYTMVKKGELIYIFRK